MSVLNICITKWEVYLNFLILTDKVKGRETVDTKVDRKIESHLRVRANRMKEFHRFHSPLVLYSFDRQYEKRSKPRPKLIFDPLFPIDSLFVCFDWLHVNHVMHSTLTETNLQLKLRHHINHSLHLLVQHIGRLTPNSDRLRYQMSRNFRTFIESIAVYAASAQTSNSFDHSMTTFRTRFVYKCPLIVSNTSILLRLQ